VCSRGLWTHLTRTAAAAAAGRAGVKDLTKALELAHDDKVQQHLARAREKLVAQRKAQAAKFSKMFA
jgi:phage terminase small subunit